MTVKPGKFLTQTTNKNFNFYEYLSQWKQFHFSTLQFFFSRYYIRQYKFFLEKYGNVVNHHLKKGQKSQYISNFKKFTINNISDESLSGFSSLKLSSITIFFNLFLHNKTSLGLKKIVPKNARKFRKGRSKFFLYKIVGISKSDKRVPNLQAKWFIKAISGIDSLGFSKKIQKFLQQHSEAIYFFNYEKTLKKKLFKIFLPPKKREDGLVYLNTTIFSKILKKKKTYFKLKKTNNRIFLREEKKNSESSEEKKKEDEKKKTYPPFFSLEFAELTKEDKKNNPFFYRNLINIHNFQIKPKNKRELELRGPKIQQKNNLLPPKKLKPKKKKKKKLSLKKKSKKFYLKKKKKWKLKFRKTFGKLLEEKRKIKKELKNRFPELLLPGLLDYHKDIFEEVKKRKLRKKKWKKKKISITPKIKKKFS